MAISTSSFDIGVLSHPGRRRAENQDSYMRADEWPRSRKELRDSYGRLYVVADGVGGNESGADASEMVVNQVMEHFYYDPQAPTNPTQRVQYAIERANEDIYDEATRRHSNMASTVVVVLVEEGRLIVANVGDSSALLFRRGTKYKKLTIEHLDADLDGRPALSQAMGDPEVSVTITPAIFKPNDVVMLCTDGLTDLVAPEEIENVVLNMSARQASEELVRLANERGGHDNITALVVRHGRLRQPPNRSTQRRSISSFWLVLGFVIITSLLSFLAYARFSSERPSPTRRISPSALPIIGAMQSTATAVITPTATLAPTAITLPSTSTPKPVPPHPPKPTQESQRPSSPPPAKVPTQAITEVPSVAPTITTTVSTETPILISRTFTSVVLKDFPDGPPSDQRASCIIGSVLGRNGGVADALLYANNGQSNSVLVATNAEGKYSICNLGASVWSIVLTFVPRSDNPSQNVLSRQVVAVVRLNGELEQEAHVNFVER